MKGLKTTLTMAIAIGLLAGSAVGVVAQDDPEAPDEQEALGPPEFEFNEFDVHRIVTGDLWFCEKKNKKNKKNTKNKIIWNETQLEKYKKNECIKTSLDTSGNIDIDATVAALLAGKSLRAALESGDVNDLGVNPLQSAAIGEILGGCREVTGMTMFVSDLVQQDIESGITGTDDSRWSTFSVDLGIAEAVEGALAACEEAIPPS